MLARSLGEVLFPCVLLVACDARIPFNEGRHAPPERTAWQVRLSAPGHLERALERRDNGALVHVLVTGAPGRYEVSAVLSGTSCEGLGGNPPVLDVRADDLSLATWSVAPGPPTPYVASFVLGPRPRRLDFLLTNALATDRCYRKVSLGSLEIRGR